VEHTDIDMSGESSEGDTFLNLAMNSPLGRLVVGRLSQQIVTAFDLDHRNAQGKTLLMQQASNTTGIAEWPNITKNLRALGADLDAKVLEKPDTSPRDSGATALHFAAGICLEKARYLLSQGANPHAISSSGHTATDRVLQVKSIARFLHWRRILVELGFDMKAFVRAEIDVHADLLWYVSNGCDEFVLGLFGFKPNFNSATGAIEFLPLSVAKALDNIVQAQDRHLSPAEEMFKPIFNDTEPEHVSSSDSDNESADEDIARPQRTMTTKASEAYRTWSRIVIARSCNFLGGLSQYRSDNPEGSKSQRSWHDYAALLETDSIESLRPRQQRELRRGLAGMFEDYGCLIESQLEYISR